MNDPLPQSTTRLEDWRTEGSPGVVEAHFQASSNLGRPVILELPSDPNPPLIVLTEDEEGPCVTHLRVKIFLYMVRTFHPAIWHLRGMLCQTPYSG